MLCFPTCFASITSGIALIALVFDLVIFYIAKSRIDSVDGASAEIGVAVWLVLAAWLVAGFAGCAYGIGNCCINRRGQRKADKNQDDYYANQAPGGDMRMLALRDEQLRRQGQKEQGLPSFQELERQPLTANEDKYLQDDLPALNRDGSVLQGVGMGYGRKARRQQPQQQQNNGYTYNNIQSPAPLARRTSVASTVAGPGAAGIGAGPGGIEVPPPVPSIPEEYGGYYGNQQQHNYYDNYNDPYAQQPYDQQYGQQQSYDPRQGYAQQQSPPQQQQQGYGQYDNGYMQQSNQIYPSYDDQAHQYPPVAAPAAAGGASAMPIPNPNASRGMDNYPSTGISADSHYSSPGPHITHADPYDAYDDGLGAIGAAATSTSPAPEHQRDYTGQNYYASASGSGSGSGSSRQGLAGIQVPTPQHLAMHNSAQELLRSPQSQVSQSFQNDPYASLSPTYGGGQGQGQAQVQGHMQQLALHGQNQRGQDTDDISPRPPSYGAVAGASGGGYPNEKSQYR